MSFIDLHIHSYYSDGFCSPLDLAEKAKVNDLQIISLTDHNGIAGVEEMIEVGEKQGIKVIPGVEIYTNFKEKHLHLLGYNFDKNNNQLKKALLQLQKEKEPIIKKTLEIIKKDGWAIQEEDILKGPSVYLGLGHIAGFLMKGQNKIRLEQEMQFRPEQIYGLSDVIGFYFKKYFYLYREAEMSITQAIELIHQAKGKAVLAHPAQQLKFRDWPVVKDLKDNGLDGLEAISGHHSWQEIDYWQRIAKEFNLFITCGSDYHGDLPGEWGVPASSLWHYFRTSANQFKSLPL